MVHIAIDGWNAAHLLKSPPVPATRNRVIEAARRLILASAGKRRVTAVFDSSQLGESFSADDVVVTFVASADEELIKMAQRDATGLVVITSDRRVREAVEKAGAVGLWSEALIEWLKTGGRQTFQP
jgi:rRNA-processing protein FCF1